MSDHSPRPQSRRSRLGWWLFVALLGLVAAFIANEFIGLLSLAVFGYYATRPICQQIKRATDSDSIAASVTVLAVLLPIIALPLYVGARAVQQVQETLSDGGGFLETVRPYVNLDAVPEEQRQTLIQVLANPGEALSSTGGLNGVVELGMAAFSALAGTILFLSLAVTLSFFLLKSDDGISAGLEKLFGGRDTTVYAYASAVDSDLESVFFGNLLFVIAMAGIAAVAYWGTNLLAPEGLQIPMVFVLAFLTGVASLIPIVVGKIVYLPVVGYLAVQAISADGTPVLFVGGVLVAYFLLLDILPQTFVQPYLSGRRLDMMLLMFSYILGPILFGWYGFFLLPILFVLMLEAIRIVLPELVHGEPLTPTVSLGESLGSDVPGQRESVDGAGVSGSGSGESAAGGSTGEGPEDGRPVDEEPTDA